eukprot:753180-Hanusia_phi.AAC.1
MSYRPHKRKRATRLDGKCVEVVGDNLEKVFNAERLPASVSYTSRWSIVIPHPLEFFNQHKEQFLSEYCRNRGLSNVKIVDSESLDDSNQMHDASQSTRVTFELERRLQPRKEILKYLCESPILVPLPPGLFSPSLFVPTQENCDAGFLDETWTELNFGGCVLPEHLLAQVGSVVPALESINLKQCSGNEILGIEGFDALCEGCRQLRNINLAGIMTLRDEQLACMHKLGSSLRSVDLGGSVCLSSDALAKFLLKAGKNLQELDLSGCQVNDEVRQCLNCKCLTNLSLGYCEASHHAMAMLFRNLKKVSVFRLVRSFPSAEMEGKDVAYKRSRAMILLIARHMGENLLHLDITGQNFNLQGCKEIKPDEVVLYILASRIFGANCTSNPASPVSTFSLWIRNFETRVTSFLDSKVLERDRPRVDSASLAKD